MPIINLVYEAPNIRRPGANTIAYYPLTSTTTTSDMSGNNKNLTKYNTVNFGNYGGVSCAYTNNNHASDTPTNYLYTTDISLPTNMTLSVWTQIISNKQYVNHLRMFGISRPNAYGVWLDTYNNGGRISVGNFYGTEIIWTNTGTTINTRYNVVTTKEGTTSKVYVNGVLLGSYTGLASSIGNKLRLMDAPSYGGLYGYLSEAIIENKARTADEITKYYNSTKADYGL